MKTRNVQLDPHTPFPTGPAPKHVTALFPMDGPTGALIRDVAFVERGGEGEWGEPMDWTTLPVDAARVFQRVRRKGFRVYALDCGGGLIAMAVPIRRKNMERLVHDIWPCLSANIPPGT